MPKIRGFEILKKQLDYDHLKTDAIQLRAVLAQIEKKTGLAADSTGVKAYSGQTKLLTKHLKVLRVRASIEAIPTGVSEAEITTGFDDGDLVYLRVNVTVASATAGATFDLGWAVLEADYKIS